MLDWSAVFLTSVHAMNPSLAGLGYAAFASTMTIGRLTGDRIVQRLGGSVVIGVGGLVAAAGFTLATLVPSWQVALIGYALVGGGCSNIVPVLFTTVGRQNVMPESVAIPAIATLGFGAVLIGPAVIGFVAHAINLPAAFLILAVLLIGVAAGGQRLRV
jgi:MFS family permease